MAPFLGKQRDPQRFLNQLDLMADRGVSQAQLGRGIADRLMARCRLKALERLERRQSPEFDLAADGPAPTILFVGRNISSWA
jgi:hypothetical protein